MFERMFTRSGAPDREMELYSPETGKALEAEEEIMSSRERWELEQQSSSGRTGVRATIARTLGLGSTSKNDRESSSSSTLTRVSRQHQGSPRASPSKTLSKAAALLGFGSGRSRAGSLTEGSQHGNDGHNSARRRSLSKAGSEQRAVSPKDPLRLMRAHTNQDEDDRAYSVQEQDDVKVIKSCSLLLPEHARAQRVMSGQHPTTSDGMQGAAQANLSSEIQPAGSSATMSHQHWQGTAPLIVQAIPLPALAAAAPASQTALTASTATAGAAAAAAAAGDRTSMQRQLLQLQDQLKLLQSKMASRTASNGADIPPPLSPGAVPSTPGTPREGASRAMSPLSKGLCARGLSQSSAGPSSYSLDFEEDAEGDGRTSDDRPSSSTGPSASVPPALPAKVSTTASGGRKPTQNPVTFAAASYFMCDAAPPSSRSHRQGSGGLAASSNPEITSADAVSCGTLRSPSGPLSGPPAVPSRLSMVTGGSGRFKHSGPNSSLSHSHSEFRPSLQGSADGDSICSPGAGSQVGPHTNTMWSPNEDFQAAQLQRSKSGRSISNMVKSMFGNRKTMDEEELSGQGKAGGARNSFMGVRNPFAPKSSSTLDPGSLDRGSQLSLQGGLLQASPSMRRELEQVARDAPNKNTRRTRRTSIDGLTKAMAKSFTVLKRRGSMDQQSLTAVGEMYSSAELDNVGVVAPAVEPDLQSGLLNLPAPPGRHSHDGLSPSARAALMTSAEFSYQGSTTASGAVSTSAGAFQARPVGAAADKLLKDAVLQQMREGRPPASDAELGDMLALLQQGGRRKSRQDGVASRPIDIGDFEPDSPSMDDRALGTSPASPGMPPAPPTSARGATAAAAGAGADSSSSGYVHAGGFDMGTELCPMEAAPLRSPLSSYQQPSPGPASPNPPAHAVSALAAGTPRTKRMSGTSAPSSPLPSPNPAQRLLQKDSSSPHTSKRTVHFGGPSSQVSQAPHASGNSPDHAQQRPSATATAAPAAPAMASVSAILPVPLPTLAQSGVRPNAAPAAPAIQPTSMASSGRKGSSSNTSGVTARITASPPRQGTNQHGTGAVASHLLEGLASEVESDGDVPTPSRSVPLLPGALLPDPRVQSTVDLLLSKLMALPLSLRTQIAQDLSRKSGGLDVSQPASTAQLMTAKCADRNSSDPQSSVSDLQLCDSPEIAALDRSRAGGVVAAGKEGSRGKDTAGTAVPAVPLATRPSPSRTLASMPGQDVCVQTSPLLVPASTGRSQAAADLQAPSPLPVAVAVAAAAEPLTAGHVGGVAPGHVLTSSRPAAASASGPSTTAPLSRHSAAVPPASPQTPAGAAPSGVPPALAVQPQQPPLMMMMHASPQQQPVMMMSGQPATMLMMHQHQQHQQHQHQAAYGTVNLLTSHGTTMAVSHEAIAAAMRLSMRGQDDGIATQPDKLYGYPLSGHAAGGVQPSTPSTAGQELDAGPQAQRLSPGTPQQVHPYWPNATMASPPGSMLYAVPMAGAMQPGMAWVPTGYPQPVQYCGQPPQPPAMYGPASAGGAAPHPQPPPSPVPGTSTQASAGGRAVSPLAPAMYGYQGWPGAAPPSPTMIMMSNPAWSPLHSPRQLSPLPGLYDPMYGSRAAWVAAPYPALAYAPQLQQPSSALFQDLAPAAAWVPQGLAPIAVTTAPRQTPVPAVRMMLHSHPVK